MGLGGPVPDPHNGRRPQREHSLREVFHGLRWLVRAGAAWRLMPHDLPPWHTVYQQSQRWLKAGVLDAIVQALCPTEYAKLSRHGCHLILDTTWGGHPP